MGGEVVGEEIGEKLSFYHLRIIKQASLLSCLDSPVVAKP